MRWRVTDTLEQLPALSRGWLADIEHADPSLYAELAPEIIVDTAVQSAWPEAPAGVDEVLARVELRGKTLGAFRFAPDGDGDPATCIARYDRRVRALLHAPDDVLIVGEYGAGNVFVCAQGVGIHDPYRADATTFIVAPDFEGFLLAQANAYDAYKAHIVRHADEAAYRARQAAVATTPRFARVDVPAIFAAQLAA